MPPACSDQKAAAILEALNQASEGSRPRSAASGGHKTRAGRSAALQLRRAWFSQTPPPQHTAPAQSLGVSGLGQSQAGHGAVGSQSRQAPEVSPVSEKGLRRECPIGPPSGAVAILTELPQVKPGAAGGTCTGLVAVMPPAFVYGGGGVVQSCATPASGAGLSAAAHPSSGSSDHTARGKVSRERAVLASRERSGKDQQITSAEGSPDGSTSCINMPMPVGSGAAVARGASKERCADTRIAAVATKRPHSAQLGHTLDAPEGEAPDDLLEKSTPNRPMESKLPPSVGNRVPIKDVATSSAGCRMPLTERGVSQGKCATSVRRPADATLLNGKASFDDVLNADLAGNEPGDPGSDRPNVVVELPLAEENPPQTPGANNHTVCPEVPSATERPHLAEIVARISRKEDPSAEVDGDRPSGLPVVASSDGRGRAASDHHCFPEEEPEGRLLGVQDLPMVGAAGVLVMPPKSKKPMSKGHNEVANHLDVALGFGDGGQGCDLVGWDAECDQEEFAPYNMLNVVSHKRMLASYVSSEVSESPGFPAPDRHADPNIEKVKSLALDIPATKPKEGPGILTLARDPKRRENCPACAAEWNQVLKQLGMQVEQEEPKEVETQASILLAKRNGAAKKTKMHSLRCNWIWFQQSLCTALCSLRFDDKGDPRARPGSPGSVLPPPMYDVWHYWRQKSGRGADRDRDRQAATERLVRGEPAS